MKLIGSSFFKDAIFNMKYGKQLGRVSNNGLACYAKNKGETTKYTIFDTVTGEILKTMNRIQQDFSDVSLIKSYRYDSQGKLISDCTRGVERVRTGSDKDNKFTCNIRNIRGEYDINGKMVHSADIKLEPSISDSKVTVLRNIDGHVSKTYINTKNGKTLTIDCVD